MNYPKIRSRLSDAEITGFIDLLNSKATILDDLNKAPSLPTADPNDDYLVVLAEAERAAIISGDKHLLDMSQVLPVFSPAELLRLLMSGEGHNQLH